MPLAISPCRPDTGCPVQTKISNVWSPVNKAKRNDKFLRWQDFFLHERQVLTNIRQPSMGPTFGIKGGAAGGGYAQCFPMEEHLCSEMLLCLYVVSALYQSDSISGPVSPNSSCHMFHATAVQLFPRMPTGGLPIFTWLEIYMPSLQLTIYLLRQLTRDTTMSTLTVGAFCWQDWQGALINCTVCICAVGWFVICVLSGSRKS